MQFDTHTIIILVGPSQSGKSTWASLFREKIQKIDTRLRVAILSSDSMRQELLQEELDRYSPQMLEASQEAFKLLEAKLSAVTTFPINNEFVVVDTTGMDSDFRSRILTLAREKSYKTAVVLFDYNTNDYFRRLSGKAKSVIAQQVESFKKKVLPSIKRKHFDFAHTIKAQHEKYFEHMELDIQNYQQWSTAHPLLDQARPVAFIGDVHEHANALEQLLLRVPENSQLVFIGDLFDKGQQTEEILTLAEKLVAQGAFIVRGNHESFIARRLRGELTEIDGENEKFSSLEIFKADFALRSRFFAIFEKTLPFICIRSHGKTIYATHAPCHNQYLGKLDEKSQKFQRNFYFSSRDENDMLSELDFVQQEAVFNHPLHIFGHVAHGMKNIVQKNKVWLDTGAVYGGQLSAFVVFPEGESKIISQSASRLSDGKLLYPGRHEKKEIVKLDTPVDMSEQAPSINVIEKLAQKYRLTPDDKYWLQAFRKSGAKFVSGTMSPARSTQTELEPVETALQYFKSHGIDKVILQPKYMGSRLQLYLHRDKGRDFGVTRSGQKTGQDLQAVLDYWHARLDPESFWQDSIILDGELLPWSAMGRELIEKEFYQYGKSIEEEFRLLSEDVAFQQYIPDFDLTGHQKELNVFLQQLELYAEESAPYYHPFTILTVDGKEWWSHDQAQVFQFLMPAAPACVIELASENTHEQARNFFNQLVFEEGYEGVVVKPVSFHSGVAPYMKVRNENYLHLIYGYDYQFHYQKMVENKKIKRKLEMSIKEYELGQKMLLAQNEEELLDLACQMKFEINQEAQLDPRL